MLRLTRKKKLEFKRLIQGYLKEQEIKVDHLTFMNRSETSVYIARKKNNPIELRFECNTKELMMYEIKPEIFEIKNTYRHWFNEMIHSVTAKPLKEIILETI